ncbi:hypothetical protein PQX77_019083 [Marasmius sp. AFHP31]|nr:hypothetical protein PQX77_019083 [Marasmius sp. AFHP31]
MAGEFEIIIPIETAVFPYHMRLTKQIMAVSPGRGTTLPPTSSTPSSPVTTDSNTSGSNSVLSSLPSSPPVATESNTSLSNLPSSTTATNFNTSASDSSRAKAIGGSVGGIAFLITLVITVVFLHKRRDRRVQDSNRTARVIHPFLPATPVLKSSRERKAPLSIPATNRKVARLPNPRVTEPTAGELSIDLQQPGAERGGGETSIHVDDNRPVDQASYRAMQAQMQLLMQRVERMEAIEEAPPEYVSAYGSGR